MSELIGNITDGIIDALYAIIDILAVILMAFAPVFFSLSIWAGAIWVLVMVVYALEGIREDIQTILKRGLSYGIIYIGIQIIYSFL